MISLDNLILASVSKQYHFYLGNFTILSCTGLLVVSRQAHNVEGNRWVVTGNTA
jgi:hypothetical protein